MHVLGSCEAPAQYSPINFFVNLFHSKNSNLPHCFSDLIHTEYRKLHKNNGHSPFVSPSIMRSSVGQCRNIRFRQLSASHVIITSEYQRLLLTVNTNRRILATCLYMGDSNGGCCVLIERLPLSVVPVKTKVNVESDLVTLSVGLHCIFHTWSSSLQNLSGDIRTQRL